jgi:hypothetical protein
MQHTPLAGGQDGRGTLMQLPEIWLIRSGMPGDPLSITDRASAPLSGACERAQELRGLLPDSCHVSRDMTWPMTSFWQGDMFAGTGHNQQLATVLMHTQTPIMYIM